MEENDYPLSNKAMEYIVALEECGTISAAAKRLFITQPALSHFIHTLEDKLGFKFFNRIGRKVVPTFEGERYLFYARRMIAIEKQMYNEFIEIKKREHGQIRFVVPTQRSSYILPRLVSAYHKQYPNVTLVISESHSRFLEKMLLDGEVDFALMNTTAENSKIKSEFIRRDEILFAVPPDDPLIGQGRPSQDGKYQTIDIALFSDAQFILQHSDQKTRQAADIILASAGIKPHILLEVRSIEAALGIVGNGTGVCFAPETYILQPHFCSLPYYFSIAQPESVYDISIAYLKDSYRPAYYQDFIETVKATVLWQYRPADNAE